MGTRQRPGSDILACVTSTRTRRCAALLLAAALPLLAAAPAAAEVPEGWSDPPEVSLLQLLVVIVGIPLVLVALITTAVLLPAIARRERLLPSTDAGDQWFGGPRHAAAELEPRRETGPTGGASGTW